MANHHIFSNQNRTVIIDLQRSDICDARINDCMKIGNLGSGKCIFSASGDLQKKNARK